MANNIRENNGKNVEKLRNYAATGKKTDDKDSWWGYYECPEEIVDWHA